MLGLTSAGPAPCIATREFGEVLELDEVATEAALQEAGALGRLLAGRLLAGSHLRSGAYAVRPGGPKRHEALQRRQAPVADRADRAD